MRCAANSLIFYLTAFVPDKYRFLSFYLLYISTTRRQMLFFSYRPLLLHPSHIPRSHRPAHFTCVQSHPRVTSPPPRSLRHALQAAPSEPGIYRFLDSAQRPLYIGKARRLNRRLRQYITSDSSTPTAVTPVQNLSPRIAAMLYRATFLDFIVTQSEAAALALEASMVAEFHPPYNVLLKDDRHHPYILVTSEPYPRILLSHTRKKKHPTDRLYGPFVNESRLRSVLSAIHAAFPLRQRPRPLFSNRPCINYDLGRCPGVCQQLITKEEYCTTVNKVHRLLSGCVYDVLKELREEMATLSLAMHYERAALVRDRIAILEATFVSSTLEEELSASAIVSQDNISRDVFAIAAKSPISKIVVFQIRAGSLISRLVFSATTNGHSAAELLDAVLVSHYSSVTHPMEVPEQVVVCTPLLNDSMLEKFLAEKRGKKVVVRGTRGLTKLADIVQRNAEIEANLEKEREEDQTSNLKALGDLLAPHFPALNPPGEGERNFNEENIQFSVKLLHRIECYDISHTSGSNAVGAVAVFVDGYPAHSEYCCYSLGNASSCRGHPDDYESIRETLRRRFENSSSKPPSASVPTFPNLIVIDGGKGQLSAAEEMLQELNLQDTISLISIAKGNEAIFVSGKSECINYNQEQEEYILNDGVRLICRIRDEAHRTAVTSHRKRRGKMALRSGLDSVAGLGTVKRSTLLKHFNESSEAVANASINDLSEVVGIGPALARRIYDHFNDSNLTQSNA